LGIFSFGFLVKIKWSVFYAQQDEWWPKKLLSRTPIWLFYDCVVNVTAIFFFQEDEDYIAAEEVKVALPFSSCFLIAFLFPSFSITPYYLDWSYT